MSQRVISLSLSLSLLSLHLHLVPSLSSLPFLSLMYRLPALVSDPQGKVALLISGVKVGEGGTSDANTAVLVTSMPSMAHVGAPPGGKGVAHVETQERTTDWLLGLDRGIPETAPRSMRIVVLCKES